MPQRCRQAGRLGMLAVVILISTSSLGCDDGTLSPGSNPWTEIGPSSEIFTDLLHSNGLLFAAAGRNGVFLQDPAFTGEWRNLGLSSTDPQFINTPYGPHSLLSLGTELFVGTWVPADSSSAPVYRCKPDAPVVVWTVASDGIEPRTILYNFLDKDGVIYAYTPRYIYASEDQGMTWSVTQTWGPIIEAVAHDGPGGTWIGALEGFGPTLLHTTGSPPTVYYLKDKISGIGNVPVFSVVTTDRDDAELMVAVGHSIYVSNDTAATFNPILGATSNVTLHVNPSDSMEFLALADVLYHSRDGGGAWDTFEPPGRLLCDGVVDWESRNIAVPVIDDRGGTIYVGNLDDIFSD